MIFCFMKYQNTSGISTIITLFINIGVFSVVDLLLYKSLTLNGILSR